MNFKKLGFLFVILMLAGSVESAFSLSHFTLTGTSSQNLTIVIPTLSNPRIGDDALTNGDEVAVYDASGNCWGASVWAGANLSITVYGFVEGDEGLGIPDEPGMPIGQLMKFRIWDTETNAEFSIVTATPALGNLNYAHNKFIQMSVLQAQLVPATPNIQNPVNNQFGFDLDGDLEWESVPNTLSYDYDLSANVDFSAPIISGNTTLTSVAFTGLSNGTLYYARVRGKNAVGDGNYKVIQFTTKLPKTVLATPANNAKAIPVSGTLNWNAVSGATSYDLVIATDALFTNTIVSTNVATNSYNYSGLLNFTDYYWEVQAVNGSNFGDFSDVSKFTTKLGNPAFTNPLDNSVGVPVSGNISWSAIPGALTYTLQIADNAGFSNPVVNQTNITGTSIAYSGLNNFTDYFARVKGVDSDGEGDYTSITFRTILGVPTNTTPANGLFSQGLSGTLQWTAVTGAALYDVQISANSAFTAIIVDQTDIAGTSFNYTGLINATEYFWRVRAKNTEGTSAYSIFTNFTTLVGAATLVSPANNASNVNPLSGSFMWNAPATATLYRIQVATDNAFTNLVYDANNLNTTSFTYTNLLSKTQYFWKIYSFNANNQGTWSNTFNFTSGLSKVVLASPATNTAGLALNNVILSWNALNGADTYRVIVSENSDLSTPIVDQNAVNTTSYTLNGLNYNKTYYWAVRGQDSFGDGPLSDIWNFGTKVDKPVLVSPANDAVDVPLGGTFSWNAAAGADAYQIEVSLVNDFASTVINQGNIVGTSYNYTNLNNNTDHYWRVRGFKNGAPGEWSNTFHLKTIQLLPPDLVSPVNNRMDAYFDITLDWNTANQATAYDVQIATDNNFFNIISSGTDLTVTEFDVTGLQYQTVYYWRARSKNDLGSSNWSATYKFTTIFFPDFAGTNNVCENQEAIYSTEASAVIDFQWTVTGGTIIGSSTLKDVTVKWTTPGNGTIKLTRTSAEWGEFSDYKQINVTVNPKDPVTTTIAPTTYYANKICVNENVTYTPSFDKTGIDEFYWKIDDLVVGTGSTLNYRFPTSGTYYISLEVFGPGCKNGQGVYQVTVTDDCPVTILADNFSTCKNSSPTIIPDVFGGSGSYGYLWTPSNDFVNSAVKNATVKNALISKQFTIKATDLIKNTYATKNIYMTVRPSITISFNKLYTIVRNADPVDITDEDILKVTVNGGTAPYTYVWKNNSGVVIDPTEIYPPLGTSKYYLTVYDSFGCASTEKRFNIIRFSGKELYDEVVPGLAGLGFMLSYPNPAVDFVNIFAEFDSESEATLKVYNLTGELVYITNIGTTKQYEAQLDVSQFTAGSYTIVIETFEDTIISRFIKR